MEQSGKEFEEIANCGGRVTFDIRTVEGRRTFQVGFSSSRPVPMSLVGIYALPEGRLSVGLVSGFGMINYDRGLCSGAVVLGKA